MNLLVVGLDKRPGAQHGGRPDTMILAVFSKGHLGLVSIPRDLYVSIPDWGMDRINATFAAAARAHKPPLEVLARVTEDTLGVPIEHTLAIDLGGFESAVNALGGIDVEVRCPIIDNFVDPRTPTGRRLLDVQAGKQAMDGFTAAMYVRSRHGRSDWSRARRQQAVLFAIKDRATSLGGLVRLPSFLDQLDSLLITNMTRSDLILAARRGLSIEPGHVHGVVLGRAQTEPHRTADGKAVLLPRPEAIRLALDGLFEAGAPGSLPEKSQCAPADAAVKYRARLGKAAG